MTPNDLLLTHLAARSADDVVVRAMAAALFGIPGEVGEAGFGAITLEDHLALFTHPEFYSVAGLPGGLEVAEVNAVQAAQYAQAVRLAGFVLNPGTHQRFVAGDAILRLHGPLSPPSEPAAPVFAPWPDAPPEVLDAIVAAANGKVTVWVAQADGPAVVTRPHPVPEFEAGLMARDVRLRSLGGAPWWPPVAERDEESTSAKIRLRPLSEPLPASLELALSDLAARHGLKELWAFSAAADDEDAPFALAYEPHPHDAFAADYDRLHQSHALGTTTVPLLSAEALADVLPRIGTRIR